MKKKIVMKIHFILAGVFKKLVDINFLCAMGPPGGGRNPVSPRLTRHFNYLCFTEMSDSSKSKIFSTILGSWMGELRRVWREVEGQQLLTYNKLRFCWTLQVSSGLEDHANSTSCW